MEVSELVKALKMLNEAKETALLGASSHIEIPELKEIYIKAIEKANEKCKRYLNKIIKWEN